MTPNGATETIAIQDLYTVSPPCSRSTDNFRIGNQTVVEWVLQVAFFLHEIAIPQYLQHSHNTIKQQKYMYMFSPPHTATDV